MDSDISQNREHPDTEAKTEPIPKPRFPFSILFLTWLLVVMVTTLVTLALPESFMSEVRIRIEREPADMPGAAQGNSYAAFDPYFIQTEMEILQSEVILGPVINDQQLNREWGIRYGDGNPLKTSESLAILKSRMDIRPIRNTSVVTIKVYGEKPAESATLANAIAEAYRAHRFKARAEKITASIHGLEDAWQENQTSVRSERAAIAELSPGTGEVNAGRLEDAKRRLGDLLRAEQVLSDKIATGKMEMRLPALSMVEIVDKARPGVRPVRPNTSLNIICGLIVGAISGVTLAALIYLLRQRAYLRRINPGPLNVPPRLKAAAHFLIALTVGVVIGYFCATPFDPISLCVIPLSVILGVLASAWIETAKLSPVAQKAPHPELAGLSA